MKHLIYMDHHATTPLDPRVLEAMMPCLREEFGNPASVLSMIGRKAESLVEKARFQAANLIGADAQEIIFTSGTTEANNLAIKGIFSSYKEKGHHIITQATEHRAVLETCRYLETQGAEVTYLPVDATGLIDLRDLEEAVTEKTILISIMAANHEVGTLQPLEGIGKIAKSQGIFFHTDAAQAAGKIPLDVEKSGIDLLSFSAHKMYGPKGTGALYVRSKNPRVRLIPLIHGGGQEKGLRAGTLNVAGIVGFGAGCEIARQALPSEFRMIQTFRDQLKKGIENKLDEVYLNGHPSERLPHNLNLSFAYVDGESLLVAMNEKIAVSSSSACSSKNPEPSYVLKAMGVRADLMYPSVRFGLGRFNTREEVDQAVQHTVKVVSELREASPLYHDSKKASGKS